MATKKTPAKATAAKKHTDESLSESTPAKSKSRKKALAKTDATEVASAADVAAVRAKVHQTTDIIVVRSRPGFVKIAGVDTPWDEANPLCDPRVRKPWFLSGELQASLEEYGQEEIGEVIELDGQFWANRGRRREANLRELQKANPDGDYWFYWTIDDKSKTDREIFERRRRSNGDGLRRNDDALTRAIECERAREQYGMTLPEFAFNEGVHEETIRNELALLKLAPFAVSLYEAGELSKNPAIQLARCGDHDDQRAVYDRLKERGTLTLEAIKQAKNDLEYQRQTGSPAPGVAVTRVRALTTTDVATPSATSEAFGKVSQAAGGFLGSLLTGPVPGPVPPGGSIFGALPSPLQGTPAPAPSTSAPSTEAASPGAPVRKVLPLSMTEVRKVLDVLTGGTIYGVPPDVVTTLEVLTGKIDASAIPTLQRAIDKVRGAE